MEKLKIGLVGCGGMMSTHLQGIQYVENAEIVAVCDIIESRAKTVSDSLPNKPRVFTNFRDMEMVNMVDAIMIALPHDLHFECGIYYALNNKHVLMEKPLCNSEEECLRLIEACEERNLKLMCAYPVRYWNGIVKLKELVDSGEFGEIIQMSVWTEQLTGAEWDYLDPVAAPWCGTARIGGGQLFSHGCHYIDLMLWFLGEPISGAHFGTRNGTPWMLKEGTSAVTIKFASGAVGYHGATWGARGTRLDYDIQIHTERGLLEYEHQSGEVRLYDGAYQHKPGEILDRQKCKILWTRDSDRSKQTQYEIQHFADSVNNKTLPLTNGRAALQSLRVIWALYNAEKNGFMADLSKLGIPEEYRVEYMGVK